MKGDRGDLGRGGKKEEGEKKAISAFGGWPRLPIFI